MPAPTFGSGYIEVDPATSPTHPLTQSEEDTLNRLDPAFKSIFRATQPLIPRAWQGDNSFIQVCALLAYRYKSGSISAPTISSLSPATGVHAVNIQVTITGTNFGPSALVLVAGTISLVPISVTPTSIVFLLPGSAIPTAGTYAITVRNADGLTSGGSNFTAT
jgi:hypothetical protein